MRRSAAVLLLGLCACIASGCGGSSVVRAANQESKMFLGDPRPRFMNVELVRNVNGDREAVLPVQGNFTIHPECPPLAGSAASKCHPIHTQYAVLEFSLPNPSSGSGVWTMSAPQIAAIAAARQVSPLFTLFPDFTEEIVRCSIPGRSPSSGTIAGTCSTQTQPFEHVKRVEFLEHWPLTRRSGTRNKAGWIVTLGRHGDVESIHVIGRPPQLGK